jgi:hypothetical protein
MQVVPNSWIPDLKAWNMRSFCHFLYIFLFAVLFVGCDLLSSGESGEPVSFSNVEREENMRVRISGTTVIRSRADWETFWKKHGGEGPVPTVDFNHQTILGVFYGGSLRGGCRSRVDVIREVRHKGETLSVEVGKLPDLGPCRMVVYPIDVVAVEVPPSQALDVDFRGQVP